MTPQSSPDAGARSTLAVSAEAIHRAGQLLNAEADRITEALDRTPLSGFQSCGGDPVSIAVAAAFNDKSRNLVERYENHVRELRSQSAALVSSAKSYDSSEDGNREALEAAVR